MKTKGALRTCKKGHQYYKNSDCPTCPQCESEKKPDTGFLSLVSSPARRALENVGINSLEELSKWSKIELLKLHGLGPAAIPTLDKALKKAKLKFK